ncbi:MAG: hypothetical protein ABR936_11815 [Bacteroidota bacterium]
MEKLNALKQPVKPIASIAEDFVIVMPQQPALALMVVCLITAVSAVVNFLFLIDEQILRSRAFLRLQIADMSNGSMEHISSGFLQVQRSIKADSGTKGTK